MLLSFVTQEIAIQCCNKDLKSPCEIHNISSPNPINLHYYYKIKCSQLEVTGQNSTYQKQAFDFLGVFPTLCIYLEHQRRISRYKEIPSAGASSKCLQ